MFIIVLSIYLPIASRASSLEDPDYRMRVISQLLRETPLIDGWVETDSGSLKTSLLLLPGTTICLGTSDSLSTTRSRRSTSVLTSARLTVGLGIVPPIQNHLQVSPWASSKWSHTDIPRLVKGKVGAQLWVAYSPCGSQHKDAVQITLEQIDLIKRLMADYSQHLQLVTTANGEKLKL